MTNFIIASFVTVVSAALGEVDWKKGREREKERKENMSCKVFSFLSPHVENKLKKKSVDFPKLRLEKSLNGLFFCFNN